MRFGSARYSVPTGLIGTRVELSAADGRLLVSDPATGDTVAEHRLVAPGEASVRDEHYAGCGLVLVENSSALGRTAQEIGVAMDSRHDVCVPAHHWNAFFTFPA